MVTKIIKINKLDKGKIINNFFSIKNFMFFKAKNIDSTDKTKHNQYRVVVHAVWHSFSEKSPPKSEFTRYRRTNIERIGVTIDI